MRNSRSQFISVFLFLACAVLLLTNGFVGRIAAQNGSVDVFAEISPIGEVLDEILRNYVREPDPSKIVEGALTGMMNSLDEHSSFIPADFFEQMREQTEGEFEGIGVTIHLDEAKSIQVQQPIAGSPAERAGIIGGDIIYKIDGTPTKGMSLNDAAERIRGPKGTIVKLGILRTYEDVEERDAETLDIEVKRGRIPLESILEYRLLDGGIGYIRVSDFKKRTAEEIAEHIAELEAEGMRSLILDLRWNPGGLLNSSREVCELFLPKNTLVTFTKARNPSTGELEEDMRLFTDREPVFPITVPMVILVNEQSASASEIVTGALQYHSRAIVVGQKTFGKGSVQTLIELKRMPGSALRLTTGLYYTPGEVCIDKEGIKPDVEVLMSMDEWIALLRQMRDSYEGDPDKKNLQNHGTVTGAEPGDDVAEDVQLQRAVEILSEDSLFDNLLRKYHRDTRETQVAAAENPENEEADQEGGEDAAEGAH